MDDGELEVRYRMDKPASRDIVLRLSAATRVDLVVGSRVAWTGGVAPVQECAAFLGGERSGGEVRVGFDRVSIEARTGQDWIRKMGADAEVRALRTLEDDLMLPAVEAPPAEPRALSFEAYIGKTAPREAVEAYRAAREWYLSPDSTDEEFFEILPRLESAAETHPEFPGHHYQLGLFYDLLQGRSDWVLACFDRAIEAEPSFYEALTRRSRILARRQRLEEAERDLESALVFASDDPEVISARGYLAIQRKEYAAAIADLELALTLDPFNADALTYLKRARNLARGPWPKEGGKREYVKETTHYRVRTDISQKKAELFADLLERGRTVFEEAFPPVRESHGKAEVLIFDSQEAYHTYAELTVSGRMETAVGYYISVYDQLCFYEGGTDLSGNDTVETLWHEAFHEYEDSIFPPEASPTWLKEGLAEFMAWQVFQKERKDERQRAEHAATLRIAMENGLIETFETFMNMTQAELYEGPGVFGYEQAATMCWWFLRAAPEGDRAVFREYLEALREGRTWRESYDATFGSIDVADMETRWLAWAKQLSK